MKFLLNFQTQKTTQEENNCRKLFVDQLGPKYGNLHSCMTQSHAVISVIHEKLYDKVQRDVSKKKLDSLTSVAAVHESHAKAETRRRNRRGIFLCRFGGDALNRVIKLQEQ